MIDDVLQPKSAPLCPQNPPFTRQAGEVCNTTPKYGLSHIETHCAVVEGGDSLQSLGENVRFQRSGVTVGGKRSPPHITSAANFGISGKVYRKYGTTGHAGPG